MISNYFNNFRPLPGLPSLFRIKRSLEEWIVFILHQNLLRKYRFQILMQNSISDPFVSRLSPRDSKYLSTIVNTKLSAPNVSSSIFSRILPHIKLYHRTSIFIGKRKNTCGNRIHLKSFLKTLDAKTWCISYEVFSHPFPHLFQR